MKKNVTNLSDIGELFKDYNFPEEKDIEEENDGIMEDGEVKNYKTLPTTSLVTVVSYMMGFDEDKMQSHFGEYNQEIISKCKDSKEATIIRCLSRLRSSVMLHFKNIDNEMLYNLGNIDRMECVPQEDIRCLRKMGIEIIHVNYRSDKYIELFCDYINAHIDSCRNLFPDWVNFEYIRDLFVIPKHKKTEIMKAEYEKFRGNINNYPFQMYIHWVPGEYGNILVNDGKFLQLIYELHGDVFRDRSKYRDAVEDTKKNIYEYIDQHSRVMIMVDCENSDVYKLHGVLKNLDAEEITKIEKIVLYDDYHTSDGWDWLEKFVSIPVEHIEVGRVTDHKSLVDLTMTAGICQAFYRDEVRSFVLCSSDSDFWGVISAIPEANFLVLYEYSKCGQDIKEALTLRNIYHCSMDDFYTGNAGEIRKIVLRKSLERETRDLCGKNAKEITKKIFADNHIDATETEINNFYEKYVKTMKLKINDDGEFYIDISD